MWITNKELDELIKVKLLQQELEFRTEIGLSFGKLNAACSRRLKITF